MDRVFRLLALSLAVTSIVAGNDFNVLQHLGGNAQWLPGKLLDIRSRYLGSP